VPFNISCGSCYFCSRGLLSNCHNVNPNATAVGGIYGYSHTCGGYDGGQAEYVRVPFADVGPTLIPDWMDDEDAVLLTDAVATGYFGAQLGDIGEGDTVVVLGAGPVGLFAARSAWFMGAARVVVVDQLEYRLEKARTFAYAETVNFAEVDDVVVQLKRTTSGLGADVVIDAVGAEADGNLIQHVTGAKLKLQGGSPMALNWAIDGVRKGGTVSVMGAYGPIFSAVRFGDAVNKGLTLRMNQAPVKRQWPRLFEHVRAGYLTPSDIVTYASRSSTSPTATTSSPPSSTTASRCSSSREKADRSIMSEQIPVYTAAAPPVPSPAELRARIPGWGVDLDPADRPAYPRERPEETGAHWALPERQPETSPRERSVEHEMLPPVFGTTHRCTVCRAPSGDSPTAAAARPAPPTGCCSSPPTGWTRSRATCAPSPRPGRTTRSPRPGCGPSSRRADSRRAGTAAGPTRGTGGRTRSSSPARGCWEARQRCSACAGWCVGAVADTPARSSAGHALSWRASRAYSSSSARYRSRARFGSQATSKELRASCTSCSRDRSAASARRT